MTGARDDRGRRLLYLGLAVAVAVDVALVAVALAQVRTPPDSGAMYIPPTFATLGPTSTPAPSSAAPPTEEPAAVPPARFLSALDDTTAWRAAASTCPTETLAVDLTTDGGGTWTTVEVGADSAASNVLHLDVIDAVSVSMLTQSRVDCAPQYTSTNSSGLAWVSSTDALAAGWFVLPSDPAVIYSPGGARAAPCVVVDWAARSADEAAVLCREQVVFRTSDGGQSWDGGLAIPGVASIDNSAGGYVVAAHGQGSCSGVEVRSLGAAASPDDGAFSGCFDARYTLGEVVISAGAGSIWVWAGTSLGVSTDGGNTWNAR